MSPALFRKLFLRIACLIILFASACPAHAQDDADDNDDPTTPLTDTVMQKFLQGLRDRGYHDLERGYLDKLAQSADVDPEFKATIDLEIGRSLTDEAASIQDFEKQKELVSQARARFDAFVKANPKHERVPEALDQLAKLHYLRGLSARLEADTADAGDKPSKLAEARTAFQQARAAYEAAEKPLKTAFEAFPVFIPETEKAKRAAKSHAHEALMSAQLQHALADYEEAQTYPIGSKQRNELLDRGIQAFDVLHKRYRTQMAGLTARAMEAKCYEEKGDDGLGPAMGIYEELLGHPDPRLRPLQRKVAWFKIIALRKRKEFALAADEAARWLAAADKRERRTAVGIGVRFELAKNIISQLPTVSRQADKDAGTKKAVDELIEITRYASDYKLEAIELLKKYKPKTAANTLAISKVNYEDAMLQADDATAMEDWPRAIAYLRAAIRKLDPTKDADKINTARYRLAYSFIKAKRYAESDVLSEYLARRYPRFGLASQGAALGMAALVSAYTSEGLNPIDLKKLVDLANYTVETWPDTEQADVARTYLGEIALGQHHFADAAKAFESVRPASSKRFDAVMKAGVAHWQMSQDKNQDPEAKTAIERMTAGLNGRKDAGIALSDPGMINNACELAEVELQRGKPVEALRILEPLAAAISTAPKGPDTAQSAFKLLSFVMRTHIANGQSDRAVSDMRQLESYGGTPTELTGLYHQLGVLLRKQIDDLAAKNDRAGVKRAQETYQQVLNAVVESKSGQTYDSLEWAGESLLELGAFQDAATVFQKVYTTYSADTEFAKRGDAAARLVKTRLKLASALRSVKQFDEAQKIVAEVIKDNPRSLEPLFELGELNEARAEATRNATDWNIAFNHWSKLAQRLGTKKPRPKDYYDAWYHAAMVLEHQGKRDEALGILKGTIRLNPKVGDPAMKAKYEALIKQLQKDASQAQAS